MQFSLNRVARRGMRPRRKWAGGPRLERLEPRQMPSFLAPLSFDAGTYPIRSEAVGDFNGDGIPDLVTANFNTGEVSVLLGVGDGSFRAARAFPAGRNPFAVAVGDFTGDGILDLAVTNFNSSTVSILLGNGDGTFQPPPHLRYGQRSVCGGGRGL